jgi:hypothetical protein
MWKACILTWKVKAGLLTIARQLYLAQDGKVKYDARPIGWLFYCKGVLTP